MSVHLSGIRVRCHTFEVPLDYAEPSRGTIEVFGREVVSAEPGSEEKPWLVFFQGGPGHGSPRPTDKSGWIGKATDQFRVFLLDQRGTGRSTPVLAQTLAGETDEAIADYLRCFRADSIVRDAETIRPQLTGGAKWTGLGQSYGGFCLTHYLSAAPEGLKAVLITGGIPPIHRSAEEVYRATFDRVLDRNRRYFERYPEDQDLLVRIAADLRKNPVHLPGGSPLTVSKLQQLGLAFGMSDGFEAIHYLLEDAYVRSAGSDVLSLKFLRGVEHRLDFEVAPIFAILHESIYAQEESTSWAADRVRSARPDFSPDRADGFLFTGEMIFPSMFDEYNELQPLRGAAHLLAEKSDWPRLYDLDRLAQNRVPVAAAVYYDDMYVESRFSEETAASIPHVQTWITNEYDHNGLRADGPRIFERLLGMVRDERIL